MKKRIFFMFKFIIYGYSSLVISLLCIAIVVGILFSLRPSIFGPYYASSKEIESYLEDRYYGSFEFIEEIDYDKNNFVGKEYLFKDDDGIIFSCYNAYSREIAYIYSKKQSYTDDNYIKTYAQKLLNSEDINKTKIDSENNFFKIIIEENEGITSDIVAKIAASIIISARTNLRSNNEFQRLSIKIRTNNLMYSTQFTCNDLPVKLQKNGTIEEIENYIYEYYIIQLE